MLAVSYTTFFLIIGVIAIPYAVLFVYKTKTGSPYLPSKRSDAKKMAKYVKKGDLVADMGSGDGRLLRMAINKGAREAWGWEIEPYIWLRGFLKLRNDKSIHLILGDMWRADLSKFDVVFVYQLERFAERFVKKCMKEMRPGTLVIANTYPLKGLPSYKKDGALYVYRV